MRVYREMRFSGSGVSVIFWPARQTASRRISQRVSICCIANIIIVYNQFEMNWGSNNIGNGQPANMEESFRVFSMMNQTPDNMPLPSPFVQVMRGRLNSMNSSFVSPMRLITSPPFNDSDKNLLYEYHLKPADKQQFEKFSLDAQYEPVDEQDEPPQEQDSHPCEPSQNLKEVNQLIRSVTLNLGADDCELERCRKKYSQMEDQQYLAVFDLLVRKLRKVKKTKQEMIKYCMRKVFRYLSEKIRNELTAGPRDNTECLKYYFGKYEHDKTFNVPFKKNSVEKTMNSSFLAKVFSCPLFVEDYRKYMKLFRVHAEKDNSKKIDALAKIVGKGIETQNLKKIDTFKRLPWTQLIINRAEDLAKSLLQYAKLNPNEVGSPQKQQPTTVPNCLKREEQEAIRQFKTKQVKKGSIILLTPPMGPLNSPQFEDKRLEQILKHCE